MKTLMIVVMFFALLLCIPLPSADAQCGAAGALGVRGVGVLKAVVGVNRRQARRAARQSSGGWALLPRNR